jgi:cytochrome c oxidase subunit 2
MRRRHPLVGVTLLALAATAIGIAIVMAIDWWPSQASTAAEPIDQLYDVLLIVSVPILVLVMSVALYSVFAFRAKPGDMRDGAPIHGNTRLEIIWVTIPFVIVSVLAGYGWVVLADVEERKPDTMTVDVTAQQFAWSFEYPQHGNVKSTQLYLPKDANVRFRIRTQDVLHSFWVPHFRLKSDTVPGLTTEIRVTPNRLGTYPVVCAELCGIGHSTMRQSVRVVSEGAFDKWVAERKQASEDGGVAAADGDKEAAGRQIFVSTGCDSCHTLADADATGQVGPSLDDLTAAAEERGKGMGPEDFVRRAITQPGLSLAPGFEDKDGLMPETYGDQLSRAEMQTLVEYLLSVSRGGGSQ